MVEPSFSLESRTNVPGVPKLMDFIIVPGFVRFFADCRAHVSVEQLAVIEQLPPCLSAHGWPVVLPEWEIMSSLFLGPQVCVQSPVCPVPVQHTAWLDLFVDGTAAFPREPKLRYAAWAVTCAHGGIGTLQHQVVLGGHVVGLNQSAYRAELTAVLAAVRWAKQGGFSVRIWSDCQSVVRGVRALMQGGAVRVNRLHSDLWLQLSDILTGWGEDHVKVAKVVSHAEVRKAEDLLEEWAYWHNKLVDAAAASFNAQRPEIFWTAWQRLFDALESHRKLHKAILQVLLKTGRKAMAAQQAAPAYRKVEVPEASVVPTAPHAGWHLPTKMFVKYGQANVAAVHRWWSAIGNSVMGNDGELHFVSGIQLFLDFYLVTQQLGPWLQNKRWFDTEAAAPMAARRPWGSRTPGRNIFLQLFHSYLGAHQILLCKKMTRPSSSSVSRWLVSYRLRYSVERLRVLDSYIFHIAGKQLTTAADLQDFSPQHVEPV